MICRLNLYFPENRRGRIGWLTDTATFLFVLILLIVSLTSLSTTSLANTEVPPTIRELGKSAENSVLLLDSTGEAILAINENHALIPASTTKLLTSLQALDTWTDDFRFTTDFYLDESRNTLWIRGNGDPFLVSEEIELIASQLVERLSDKNLTSEFSFIATDVSLFSENLVVPGQSTTDNPYDAFPGALVANFNTLNLATSNGQVVSAEPQTPLTPMALKRGSELLAKSNRATLGRVNTGFTSEGSGQYFAEILAAMLIDRGLSFGSDKGLPDFVTGPLPKVPLVMQYHSSRKLGDVIPLMLEFSNNFIANQLALTLASDEYGTRADFTSVALAIKKFTDRRFGRGPHWVSAVVKEGAGLSRDNRLSASQLVDIVSALSPWKQMVPEYRDSVRAKTGTLNGVSTLAGFIDSRSGNTYRFAVLINEAAKVDLMPEIVDELVELAE